jgi:hypothetical protein
MPDPSSPDQPSLLDAPAPDPFRDDSSSTPVSRDDSSSDPDHPDTSAADAAPMEKDQ